VLLWFFCCVLFCFLFWVCVVVMSFVFWVCVSSYCNAFRMWNVVMNSRIRMLVVIVGFGIICIILIMCFVHIMIWDYLLYILSLSNVRKFWKSYSPNTYCISVFFQDLKFHKVAPKNSVQITSWSQSFDMSPWFEPTWWQQSTLYDDRAIPFGHRSAYWIQVNTMIS